MIKCFGSNIWMQLDINQLIYNIYEYMQNYK